MSHSSFLCLSAHASPKALLPLRYLGAAHTRERNIPTLYIQFKKSTELKFREKKMPEGKSDMERVGLFSEMEYHTIGDRYAGVSAHGLK